MKTNGIVLRVFLTLTVSVLSSLSWGSPPVLRWDPSVAGHVWNTTATNWLDAGDNLVAWIPGAEATFESTAGDLVVVGEDVSATNLTFTGNGYTVIGAGRLLVEGSISVAGATTNSLAAELVTRSGLAKTGSGALALARCAGPMSVQAGSLLAAGSLFVDAEISVADGASLITLGEPDTASNLLLNPSFELAPINGWSYVAYGAVISNWVVTALPDHVGLQNPSINTTWNSNGSVPDGSQMLIVQYDGAIEQTVTVPADGLYSIAFSHLLRRGYPEAQVYVTLDGLPLATFLNRNAEFNTGRFASGALWLAAGEHTLGLHGESGWGDRASMIDAVCFAAPSAANGCRALGGDSLLAVADGASVRLEHAGTVPLVHVSTNGAAASGTFDAAHASGIFSGTGALSCAAPETVYSWNGTGLWSEAARWDDGAVPPAGGGQDLLVRFPLAEGAASTNDLAGEFLTRRLWAGGMAEDGLFALEGETVVFTNSWPKLTQRSPGSWTIAAPLVARTSLTLETAGDVTLEGHALGVAASGTFYKSGPGTLSFPSFTNSVSSAVIYEGTVETPQIPSSLAVGLYSQSGKSSALRLTQGNVSLGNTVNLYGSGTAAIETDCGGGTVTFSNWTYGFGDNAVFDVGTGDTLSLRQMLLFYNSRGYSATALTKTGAGTLEIRSAGADTGNNRAYRGITTLRNGTLKVSEDDWGTLSGWANSFNGRTYSGTGGSLGYSLLTNALVIGDSDTAASDDLAFIANGDGRWIGRDIEIFNQGNTVTLGMTTGTVMFAGTVTLHRDIILSGPADGVMVFNNVEAAGDYAGLGLPTLEGLAGLRIEGAFPSVGSLVMGARGLSFGTLAVKAQTLNFLSLGLPTASATLDIDFSAGNNDTIATTMSDGLVLSNTVVNLYYAGTGLPFAEPGTYTLFTYVGTLGGDVARLSVGNPQSGASYVFANDAGNSRVTLTISGTSGGASAIWTSAVSGSWGLGANWYGGSVPDGSGVVPLFGLAITNAAAVDTGSGYTVGGLIFNNGSFGYTLAGSGGLTLATNDATPLITVSAGTHTIDTALNGSDGLEVATTGGGVLALGGGSAVNTGLSLTQGMVEMRGNASVIGATDLADDTQLLAKDTTNAVVGTFSGVAGSALTLSGTAAKLTVNQTADGVFGGTLFGGSDEQLVKAGGGKLTLSAAGSPFSGQIAVSAGTLALQSTVVPSAITLNGSASLEIAAPVTNGLAGFYYSVTPNTNAFWTLAAMETHFASLTPDLASLSGSQNTNFDFTTSGSLFPQPYGAGGSRTTYFEAVYRGTVTVPESGIYFFGVQGDDGFLLAIDGQTVVSRNYYSTSRLDGNIRLDAGRHDIVFGYFQMSGGYGLQLYVRPPSATALYLLPSAWLTPYSAISSLTGDGALAHAASNALARINSSGVGGYRGAFSGAAGSFLAKSGSGTLALDAIGAGSFDGDIDVQEGVLALASSGRIGDGAILRTRSGATLSFVGQETVGGLAGAGTLAMGGYTYATAFSGDADSGISSAKTYTHALDFPSGTADAVVNGVTFYSSAMSGTRNGYSWSTSGTVPGGAMNQSPYDTSYSGVTSLLWDFFYGSTNFTITLSGLDANKLYETRIYFRNWASNQRDLTFTFTAGATLVGSIDHNPDSVTRSVVGCRYRTDSAGTVSIQIVSHRSSDTCHLYGMSNEEVTDASEMALTLAPAAGQSARFTGTLSGQGSLAKTGVGTQIFGGANLLPVPLGVQAGTVTLEAGASVTAGVAVASGATLEAPCGGAVLGGLSGEGEFSLGFAPTDVGPYFVNYTNDAGTGISTAKTYTHLLDFGGASGRAVVNGVAFDKATTSSGTISGTPYGWSGIPGSAYAGGNAGNIGVASDQGIYNLLYDMNYNATTTTISLTGLTIGKRYEVRFYNRRWETAYKDRTQTFIFDPDGNGPLSDSVTFNPDDDAVKPNDNYLGYRYLAATNYLKVTIQTKTKDTYHLYGLSNEESCDTLGDPVTLDIAESAVFDGAITGLGGLAKTGAGAFTVTGNSTATGPVAVNAGAFGVAGGGCATLGPVSVGAGATVFGNGRMGGSVSVASNGWLMAGTAAACGSLQVGGDLMLVPGARLAYRFDAGGVHDTVTIDGLLTFPTNGVVQASALTAGTSTPAKQLFFASPLVIDGPDDLTGWTVEGVENAQLKYSADRKEIYFYSPSGTLLLLQ